MSDERRLEFFCAFWDLPTKDERRALVCQWVQSSICRGVRKSMFHKYTLAGTNVCKDFFLSTLVCGQGFLEYTLKNRDPLFGTAKKGRAGGARPHRSEAIVALRQFIEGLPVQEPHYTRRDSTKRYLPQGFESLSKVYRLYVKHVQRDFVSKPTFLKTLKEYNVGITVPKKDKCKMCSSKDEVAPTILQEHTALKNRVNEYHLDRQKAASESHKVISFDLQKVLATPHGNSMTIGYSRKYAYYNQTAYESGSQKAYCFCWGEVDGGRGANEVVSCLQKYLVQQDTAGIETVEVFADSCAGQNKNRAMAGMLIQVLLSAQSLKALTMTFLIPGHTYMPVDSVHSLIERSARNRPVWAPSQWDTVIEYAIVDPNKKPYEVIHLKNEEILDWKALGNSMFPQHKKNVRWSSVRQFHTTVVGGAHLLRVKYDIDDEWEVIQPNKKRGRGQSGIYYGLPDRAYQGKLPISVQKYNDLAKFCTGNPPAIPRIHHEEYRQMRTDAVVRDCLIEPDEDEVDEAE